jgi:hypothetical protein
MNSLEGGNSYKMNWFGMVFCGTHSKPVGELA